MERAWVKLLPQAKGRFKAAAERAAALSHRVIVVVVIVHKRDGRSGSSALVLPSVLCRLNSSNAWSKHIDAFFAGQQTKTESKEKYRITPV